MIGKIIKRTGRTYLIPLWIAVIGLGLLTGCAPSESNSLPRAEDGVLDLRDRPFEANGVLPLEGEWAFEWHGDGQASPVRSKLKVPRTWGGAELGDDVKLSDQGRGVYKLTILHEPEKAMLAVRLPNISTSYDFYVDGERVLSRGKPGAEAGSARPYQLPATVYFDGGRDRTELVLDVSNFDHRRGGIRTELIMGTAEQIQKLEFNQQAQEMIVFGCLIMIGLYHMGLYVLRRKESTNLFFALLCLFVACRMGVIGEGMFFRWLPELTWTAGTRLEYTSFALSALFGFAYYQRMYPNEIARGWLLASRIGGAALLLACWLLPVLHVSSHIAFYQAYVLILSARTLAGLMVAWYRKREGARLALIGVAGLVATIVNDIFFYNGWWRSYDLVSFGLLFLILLNSFAISLRFSRTFVRAEQMSAELKEWNLRLEERIAERTEELRRSYAELEESKIGLERMEQSRRQLVSNISHDLRTPMTLIQGYLEALRDGVISDPKQRDSTIRSMLTKVEGLNGLIQDLFELSMLEARRAPMTYETVRLPDWLRRLTDEYEPELKEKGIEFVGLGEGEDFARGIVRIDEHRMDRVFANLIYNAVKYTPKGGRIALSFSVDAGRRTVQAKVSDTGSGIHPDDLPYIFERFFKNDKSRHSSSGGSGLGLSIAKEIVEMHDGRLAAENGEKGGSVFIITLPLHAAANSEVS